MFHTKKRGFFWKNWAKIPLKICGKVYEIFEHITERFSRFWKITTPVDKSNNIGFCETYISKITKLMK